MLKARVLDHASLSDDVVVLADDGNSARFRCIVQNLRPRIIFASEHVGGQDYQRCAIAVRPLLELLQGEFGKFESLAKGGRWGFLEEHRIHADGCGEAPALENRLVARTLAQEIYPIHQSSIPCGVERYPRIGRQPSPEMTLVDELNDPRSEGLRLASERRQSKGLPIRVWRPEPDASIRSSLGEGVRCMIWIPSLDAQCSEDRGGFPEVVDDEDQSHEIRTHLPRVSVIEWQLTDLCSARRPERRGGDVQVGNCLRGEFLEPYMDLVRYLHFTAGYERISHDGHVAAFGCSFWGYGFAVEKAQAVGARYRPVIQPIGHAHFTPRLEENPHFRHERAIHAVAMKRRSQAEEGFRSNCDNGQSHDGK